MKSNGLMNLAGRGRAGAVAFVALAMAGVAGSALAGPTINVVYDPGATFSTADKAAIQNALNFYTANMTSNFTVTVAIGTQAGGGGSSEWFAPSTTYNAYYNALVGHSSGDATDTSAIASLGGGPQTINPVTGSPLIDTTSTLASALGVGSQISDTFSACGGLTANACIDLSQAALNVSGAPLAGLGGIVQHEFDEVLGTASNLPNGGGTVPADPMAGDLFRYSAPGVRSFALNPSTDVPCTGSPTAYFSVDGGVTNAQNYNNCNNGGDYGDWIGTSGTLVQDAFGPDTQAAALNASSPEVQLLDAVGYNFDFAGGAAPEPQAWALMILGLGAVGAAARSRRRAAAAATR